MNNYLAVIENPFVNTSGNLSGSSFISSLIQALVSIGFIVGAVVFVFMLIIGGIQWISSGDDKAKLESARGRISSAIVGLVVLFTLYAIIQLVENFFNENIIKIDLSSLRIN